MFITVDQWRYGLDSKEWYLAPCFLGLNTIYRAELRTHNKLGLVVAVVWNDEIEFIKLQDEALPFPACVEVR